VELVVMLGIMLVVLVVLVLVIQLVCIHRPLLEIVQVMLRIQQLLGHPFVRLAFLE
jgi:hypothetical protein